MYPYYMRQILSKPRSGSQKVRVKEEHTGEYVSQLAEKKNTASLICIESQASRQRFGMVTEMFKHTFATGTQYLALIQFYDVSTYDRDDHMW